MAPAPTSTHQRSTPSTHPPFIFSSASRKKAPKAGMTMSAVRPLTLRERLKPAAKQRSAAGRQLRQAARQRRHAGAALRMRPCAPPSQHKHSRLLQGAVPLTGEELAGAHHDSGGAGQRDARALEPLQRRRLDRLPLRLHCKRAQGGSRLTLSHLSGTMHRQKCTSGARERIQKRSALATHRPLLGPHWHLTCGCPPPPPPLQACPCCCAAAAALLLRNLQAAVAGGGSRGGGAVGSTLAALGLARAPCRQHSGGAGQVAAAANGHSPEPVTNPLPACSGGHPVSFQQAAEYWAGRVGAGSDGLRRPAAHSRHNAS